MFGLIRGNRCRIWYVGGFTLALQTRIDASVCVAGLALQCVCAHG
jgi:hypothetical protein